MTTLDFMGEGLVVSLEGSWTSARHSLGARHGLWSSAWSWILAWSLELGMVFGCLGWSLLARHGLENWFLLQVMYLIFCNELEDENFRD